VTTLTKITKKRQKVTEIFSVAAQRWNENQHWFYDPQIKDFFSFLNANIPLPAKRPFNISFLTEHHSIS